MNLLAKLVSVLGLLMLAGCACQQEPALLTAAKSLKVGMTRAEVQSRLGKPKQDFGFVAYYGKVVKCGPLESPYTPYEMTVYYQDNGAVLWDVSYYDRKHFFRASEKDWHR